MAQVLSEDRFVGAGHYIVSEANLSRSREQGIVAAGAGILKAGAVMGRVTATKAYVPFNPEGADGSETAVAVLYEGCDATTEAVRRTFSVRQCEVHADVLHFADGVTDPEKTEAMASLAEAGIIGR